MALPRPLLLAVLGLALVLTALLALGRMSVLGSGSAEEAAPAPATPPAARAPAPPGLPAPVTRALRERRVVVLLLTQDGAADDAATGEAVAALERDPPAGAAVFRDGIENLGRYRAVLRDLGVAQVPAVVVVGPDRRAAVLEGYVDAGSLRQRVVDARP
jgi:hypothetical protein